MEITVTHFVKTQLDDHQIRDIGNKYLSQHIGDLCVHKGVIQEEHESHHNGDPYYVDPKRPIPKTLERLVRAAQEYRDARWAFEQQQEKERKRK